MLSNNWVFTTLTAFFSCRFTYAFQVHDWIPEDKRRPDFIVIYPHTASVASLVVEMCKRLPTATHTLTCDNYFTSCKAFRELRTAGWHAVGTIKSNSDVPSTILWPKRDAKRARGTARFQRTTDRMLMLQEWQDGGKVSVLSTGHSGVNGPSAVYKDVPGIQSVKRWRKAGLVWVPDLIPVPPAVQFYQTTMGGVDRSDQV